LEIKLDPDRQERIRDLYPTLTVKELAGMYDVTPRRIQLVLMKNYKQYKKKLNDKYLKKLRADPVRYARIKSNVKNVRRQRYWSDPEFRKRLKEINKGVKKTWLAIPENRIQNNKGAQRLYSINTGKFIKDFFRSLENE